MSKKKDVIEFFKAKGLENQISFMVGRFGDFSKMIMIWHDKDGFHPEI